MNRVVIVTGASGGLGSAVAKRFGTAGDRVVVSDEKGSQDAENVAKEINSSAGEAFVYQADVCDYMQVKKMADHTVAKWGRIDIIVNCAGGSVNIMKGKPWVVAEMENEIWDMVVDLNLKGTFNSIKAVLPQMIKQREGHIINISSGMGLSGIRGSANYAAAKAGVIGLTKSVAIEVGEHNIQVNALCPGLIVHEGIRANYPPDRYESIKNMNLLRRTGSPEEFADFVFHLSTMKNISGQTINLDSRILF
ncbi:SDR family NAD(P)-dependent oxidoreductase [Chloroflexota bacterium]